MARITVEDCLEKVDNRFELVLIATKRARQLAKGEEPLVDRDNDKNTVIALREIAEGLVTAKILDEDETAHDAREPFIAAEVIAQAVKLDLEAEEAANQELDNSDVDGESTEQADEE